MLNLIKSEWSKVCLPVLATTFILSIIMCVLSCTLYQNYALQYDLEAWEVGTEMVNLLFPLFVVLPVCWNLYYERKNNFLFYVRQRVRIGKYLAVKWLVQTVCAFFILFIPYVLSAIFSLYVKPPIEPFYLSAEASPVSHVFLHMFAEAPMVYVLVLSFWKGIIGILVMTLGFVLSMYVKNIFVVLTGPFIYAVLENFILSALRFEKYRLVVSYEPTTIAVDAYSIASIIVAPVLLLALCGAIWLYFAKVRKNTVV